MNSSSRAIRTSCTISPRCPCCPSRNDKVQHRIAFRSGIRNACICSRCTCSGRADLDSGSRAIRTSCTIRTVCPCCPSRNDEVQHSVIFRSGVGDTRICPRCTCGSRANLNSGSRAICTICSRCSSRNDKVQHSIAVRSGVDDAGICSRCTCSGCANLNSGSRAICTICSRCPGRNDEVQHRIAFRSSIGNARICSRCTRGSRADLNSGSHTSCTSCPCRTRCTNRSRYTRRPLKTTRWHWRRRWTAATVRIFRIITCHKVFPLFVFLTILSF